MPRRIKLEKGTFSLCTKGTFSLCANNTIANDFAEHGAEAIAKVRVDDPATYLKIVGSLVPRELIMQREESPAINSAEITDEELVEVIDRRKRQKFVEGVLKSID